jgi:4-hydroxy-3-methylbut-2-enyl diphosphate reductase
VAQERWLPEGAVAVGLTAGASTPNNVVGEVVEKILARRGLAVDALVAL